MRDVGMFHGTCAHCYVYQYLSLFPVYFSTIPICAFKFHNYNTQKAAIATLPLTMHRQKWLQSHIFTYNPYIYVPLNLSFILI